MHAAPSAVNGENLLLSSSGTVAYSGGLGASRTDAANRPPRRPPTQLGAFGCSFLGANGKSRSPRR